ncbi:septal ring lytic transglycosylase RlpA family protein [Tunturiibacter empetritectus]|uniref:Probable endolytic peptidoglycan transglycosylase RlpA n=2 Tax=Tunturiibacter TaxID=3154218 RepID=A0A852VHA7_9BACT|nr:septal ring lytic transglycosylase RlpA family protein [Edaphobacter lichenicola]NYF89824.1 rare lipoprotein A [Edaphobacter lichenicola]
MKRTLMMFFVAVLGLAPVVMAQGQTVGQKETGLAAVYSSRLNGHVTASGQMYNGSALTAAHKTLPYGTKIKVTNTKNDKSVVLQVNDRGPVQAGRILDITPAAAARLGIPRKAMRDVPVEVIEQGNGKTTRQHAE